MTQPLAKPSFMFKMILHRLNLETKDIVMEVIDPCGWVYYVWTLMLNQSGVETGPGADLKTANTVCCSSGGVCSSGLGL
jgi:hypothetical protein